VVRLTAKIHGQMIVDLTVNGDKEIEYKDDVSGGKIGTLKSLKTLMTHLSSELCNGAWNCSRWGMLKLLDTNGVMDIRLLHLVCSISSIYLIHVDLSAT
jgi:hypothetical protein